MVASTKRWATSSEASISTRVAVRVFRIETAAGHERGKKINQLRRPREVAFEPAGHTKAFAARFSSLQSAKRPARPRADAVQAPFLFP